MLENIWLVIHWLLWIIVCVAIIGALVILLFMFGRKYLVFFKEKQADEVSVFVVLTDLAAVVFLAEQIKSVLSIYLLLLMIFIFVLYTVIRLTIQAENVQARNGILKCAGITAGCIVGVSLMVHFIGPLVIIVIPIGIFLVASGN